MYNKKSQYCAPRLTWPLQKWYGHNHDLVAHYEISTSQTELHFVLFSLFSFQYHRQCAYRASLWVTGWLSHKKWELLFLRHHMSSFQVVIILSSSFYYYYYLVGYVFDNVFVIFYPFSIFVVFSMLPVSLDCLFLITPSFTFIETNSNGYFWSHLVYSNAPI